MTGPAYTLNDIELSQALSIIRRLPHLLNDWEQSFARDLPTFLLKRGSITWSQRRTARQIVDRVLATLSQLHNRTDLYLVNEPTLTPMPMGMPAPIMWSETRRLSAPIPEPAKIDAILGHLTPRQIDALVTLSDGEWHETALKTGDGKVAGTSARALRTRSLVEDKHAVGDRWRVRLTRLGHQVTQLALKMTGRQQPAEQR